MRLPTGHFHQFSRPCDRTVRTTSIEARRAIRSPGSPTSKARSKASLKINANAQLDYQETIIQSGVAFEVAKWGDASSYTALDVMGSARYWSQDVDLSLKASGTLTADVQADFRRVGLDLKRKVKGSRAIAVAHAGDLEWVDPVVGGRMRHQFASGSEFNLEGDVGGFGAGSDSPGRRSPPTASM